MSCARSSPSVETDCKPNMGDVLGKEPEEREDQLSDPFNENMEREEAEGAEAEDEISLSDIKDFPGFTSDPGEEEQVSLLCFL